MIIRSSTWHAKVYRWFIKDCGSDYAPYTANLCPYMRTVLFWAPLRWLLISGRIGPVRVPMALFPSLFVTLPAIFAAIFGWEDGLTVLSIYLVILTAFALSGVIVATVYAIKLSLEKLGHVQALDTFANVSTEYVRGVHSKICPMIRFTNGE